MKIAPKNYRTAAFVRNDTVPHEYYYYTAELHGTGIFATIPFITWANVRIVFLFLAICKGELRRCRSRYTHWHRIGTNCWHHFAKWVCECVARRLSAPLSPLSPSFSVRMMKKPECSGFRAPETQLNSWWLRWQAVWCVRHHTIIVVCRVGQAREREREQSHSQWIRRHLWTNTRAYRISIHQPDCHPLISP